MGSDMVLVWMSRFLFSTSLTMITIRGIAYLLALWHERQETQDGWKTLDSVAIAFALLSIAAMLLSGGSES